MALSAVLAEIYSDAESIRRVAAEAGIDVARVNWNQTPINVWTRVIQEAQQNERMPALAAVAMREYPTYVPLHLAFAELVPAAVAAPDPIPVRVGRIEQRVDNHETLLKHIMSVIDPGPRRRTAMALFWGILVVLGASWLIVEFRMWYLANPVQAIGISLAAIVAALIVRWLPEADHGDKT